MRLQMGWERRSAPFGTGSPAGGSHHTLPPQAGAEPSPHLSLWCPCPPPLCLGSPTASTSSKNAKPPSDFCSEPFVILKGKIIQGSSIQEDFGVSPVLISLTARPGAGLKMRIYQKLQSLEVDVPSWTSHPERKTILGCYSMFPSKRGGASLCKAL